MLKKLNKILLLPVLFTLCVAGKAQSPFDPYFLIAHRGGIADSAHTENSLSALQEAVRRGYWMIEVDMRLTKDSVFIAQHDADFLRFFGVDKPVTDLAWKEIKKFRSDLDGSRVMTLEEILSKCKGKLQVMIDNKVRGNDTILFAEVVRLLKKYDLHEHALMIGTEESTAFFTGKVKLSCTRKQLDEYKKKPGFNPAHYYLFDGPGRLTKKDVEWAAKEDIMTVAAINRPYKPSDTYRQEAMQFAEECKAWGVRYFQIDAEFEAAFRDE